MNRFSNRLSLIGESLGALFYPRLCPACSRVLYGNEKILCLKCTCELPRTNFHLDPGNEVAKLFWGRAMIQHAASFFYYQKGSRYQNIIHAMKYGNRQQLGVDLGRWYGLELRDSPFARADLIHPVPLHRSKKRARGYNQSERIALGISEALGIPMATDLIERAVNTDTQTRKSKYERWSNVEGIFRVADPGRLREKHVLLVDDVVTTGSTLEACAAPVLALGDTRVSLLTLACVKIH